MSNRPKMASMNYNKNDGKVLKAWRFMNACVLLFLSLLDETAKWTSFLESRSQPDKEEVTFPSFSIVPCRWKLGQPCLPGTLCGQNQLKALAHLKPLLLKKMRDMKACYTATAWRADSHQFCAGQMPSPNTMKELTDLIMDWRKRLFSVFIACILCENECDV